MKRIALFLLAAAALILPADCSSASPPDISAASAVVLAADSGERLYEKDADARMLIASTTKIMTALVVLENCELTERVRIDAESAATEGSSMYLREGGVYTVEELLLGLMLVSGNDAASALAKHVSGSEKAFAEEMNAAAREMGLENTHFANPHGLDAEGHYSSAGDLALIAAEAMENEDFRRIASTKYAEVHGQTLKNHNRLLFTCPGCVGVKTGYTMAAGRTLVSCAERDGLRLIVVTLMDKDDWRDHEALYDWAFGNWELREIVPGTARFRQLFAGSKSEVALRPAEAVRAVLARDAEAELVFEISPFALPPVREGEDAGKLTVFSGGEAVAETRLVYAETVLN